MWLLAGLVYRKFFKGFHKLTRDKRTNTDEVMANNDTTLHGWTPVVRDHQALLSGNHYINKPSALSVKDIQFPSDDLVSKVREHAEEKLPAPTFNHSMRVFYFGTPGNLIASSTDLAELSLPINQPPLYWTSSFPT